MYKSLYPPYLTQNSLKVMNRCSLLPPVLLFAGFYCSYLISLITCGTGIVQLVQQQDFLDLPPPDEFMEKFKALLESTQINVGAKARRVIDMLEDVFARSWILSRHLAIIVEVFSLKYGFYKQTKFHGSYRVELIIALFNRVIDLHNFECVVSAVKLFPKCFNC